MSALEHAPQQRLAELLMIAATRLPEPDPSIGSLVPIGVPVRRGRLHLGRARRGLCAQMAGGLVTTGMKLFDLCQRIRPDLASLGDLGQPLLDRLR